MYWLIDLMIYWFIDSLIDWFIYLLTYLFIFLSYLFIYTDGFNYVRLSADRSTSAGKMNKSAIF